MDNRRNCSRGRGPGGTADPPTGQIAKTKALDHVAHGLPQSWIHTPKGVLACERNLRLESGSTEEFVASRVGEVDASILLVDNEPRLLVAYERLLRGLGCKVLCAQRLREALQCFSSPSIALIIVDPCLVDGDGLELVRVGRRMQPPASGIVMAALPSPDGARRATEAGAVGYLAKPFSGRVFVALAEKQLETWRAAGWRPTVGEIAPPGEGKPK